MIKKYAILLAALLVLYASTAYAQGFLMSRAFSTDIVAPLPLVTPGAGWSGPTAQPATIGSNSTFGYNDNVIAGWDTVPYQMAAGDFEVCVIAFHVSGVSNVVFAVDGGAWVLGRFAKGPSGLPEYCAKTNDSYFSDGQHEFRAIAYPNVGVPRVLQSSMNVTAVSGNSLLAIPAHGQAGGKPVVFSGSGGSGFVDGQTYYVSWTGISPGGYAVSATSGGSVITPTGNASFTVTYPGSGNNEAQGSIGESLWFNTNFNGAISVVSAYADSVNGSDANSCTSASPCATIYAAEKALMPAATGLSFTASNGSCNLSRGGTTFKVGEGVVISTSGVLPTPLAVNTLYWVVSSSGGTVTLATTPGGSCMVLGTSGASGAINLNADVGNDTIYLRAGNYALGNASEPSITNARQGWLTVTPEPGVPQTSVAITSLGNASGLRTNKVHLLKTNLSGIASNAGGIAIWLDSLTSTGTGQNVGNSTLAGGPTIWTYGVFVTNVTASEAEYGINPAILARNNTLFDTGSGSIDNALLAVGNITTKNGVYAAYTITTTSDTPIGQTVLHFAPGVLPPGFGTNSFLQWPTTNCVNLTAYPSSGALIDADDMTVGTLTLDSPTIADCPAGTTFNFTLNGYHTHWRFNYPGGVNEISYGNIGNSQITGEGFFIQGNSFIDFAEVDDSVTIYQIPPYGFLAILINSPLTNGYFVNNYYSQGVGTNDAYVQAGSSELLFLSDTCRTAGSIKNNTGAPISSLTNAFVIGGNC